MLLKIQHPDDRAHLARRLRQQITPSLVVLAGELSPSWYGPWPSPNRTENFTCGFWM